jgi:hypothetical protein
MDIRAMATGILARDQMRIQQSAAEEMERARQFQSRNDLLGALRELQSVVRDFSGLTDVSAAERSLSELRENKAVKKAEKEEVSALGQQAEMTGSTSAQMRAIAGADRDDTEVMHIRGTLAELKKQAADSRDPNSPKTLVVRRALGALVVEAYESGQRCMDEKNYGAALVYFDLVSAGSGNPAWAHYQRARAYAMLSDRKNMLAELRLSSAGGFHETSALEAAEFQAFQQQPEFQALVAEWRQTGEKEESKP